MLKLTEKLMCSGHNCIEDHFFTKNFSNGIVTHCSYDGISMEQNPNVVFKFKDLFEEIKPNLIIEIGTFHGGLTLLLRELLNEINLSDTKLITYDVNIPQYLIEKNDQNSIDIRVKNLFSENYSDWAGIIEVNEIKDLISNHQRIVILCDGGSKKNEFRMISPLLKSGDVIMAHDYCPNSNYFETNMKNKVWNWMEIQDSDIEDTVSSENLKPYMFEEFLEVAWVCKVK
jgi:cephalosporin hydroxylase